MLRVDKLDRQVGSASCGIASRHCSPLARGMQVAARMASASTSWKQFDAARQALMRTQLQRIVALKGKGLSESVSSCGS